MGKARAVSCGPVESDRREHVRVNAHGSVIVYGNVTTRGRLSNISSAGMLMRPTESGHGCRVGEAVDVDLHLDRTGATWLRFRGEAVRSERGEVAISFSSVPLDFADVVQDALLSALEGSALPHILIVDTNTQRRAPFAGLLRRAGCRVAEVGTPLDAIAYLGGSSIHSWVVAIAGTVPKNTGDELEQFLMESDAPVEVRMLGDRSPTSALAWFTATVRRPS